MSKRHRLVVEFASAKDMDDFAAEVAEHRGVLSGVRIHGYVIVSTDPYKPGSGAANHISGSTSGTVVQTGGNIIGGVHL